MPVFGGQDAGPIGGLLAGSVSSAPASLVVAGTTTVFDASSLVSGSAPPTETLSCNDNWTGGGASAEWDSAANWTTGVPNGTGVDVCIPGSADVLLSDCVVLHRRAHGVGGSSLTIGTAAATATTATGSTSPAAATATANRA